MNKGNCLQSNEMIFITTLQTKQIGASSNNGSTMMKAPRSLVFGNRHHCRRAGRDAARRSAFGAIQSLRMAPSSCLHLGGL
jgi:hypothetical protein